MIKTIGLFFLMLLKICGWLLLAAVLVLLIVLLLVCFVPVRYDASVENDRIMDGSGGPFKNIRMRVNVSWLLRFIHVSAGYGPDGLDVDIRAAGIHVQKALAWLQGRKKAKQGRRKKHSQDTASSEPAAKPKASETPGLENQEAELRAVSISENLEKQEELQGASISENPESQEPELRAASISENTEKQEKLQGASISENPESQEKLQGASISKNPESHAELQKASISENPEKQEELQEASVSEKMEQAADFEKNNAEYTAKPAGKKKKQKRAFQKKTKVKREKKEPGSGAFHKIRDKYRQFRKEYTDETNRHAVKCLWKELCFLLRHYKPRRMEADIEFSLADPARTGMAVGMFSLIPVIYRYPCSIVPDFSSDRLYAEGRFFVKGKVTVFIFLLSLLHLIRDREFRKTVRRLLKRG